MDMGFMLVTYSLVVLIYFIRRRHIALLSASCYGLHFTEISKYLQAVWTDVNQI